MEPVLRIVIVDDQRMFREGVRTRLHEEPDFRVVGEASTGEEALAIIEETRPDIVILDIRLPTVSGIEVAQRLRQRWADLKLLVLTGYDFDQYVRALARIGIQGYLLKGSPPGDVVDAIRQIAGGGTVLAPGVASILMRAYSSLLASKQSIQSDNLSMSAAEGKASETSSVGWPGATAAAWAHRLTNTLGVVRMLIQEMERASGDSPVVLRYGREIEEQVRRSLEVARDVRAFSRASAGSEVGPVSVNATVRRISGEYSGPHDAGTEVPRIDLHLGSDLPNVKADAKLLGEVLRNLLDNALRAVRTRPDGLIVVRTHAIDAHTVAIDVSDNGSGMPKEVALKAFKEPIVDDRSRGSGIGLFLSKSLVDSWSGSLTLLKSNARGTAIRVSLETWQRPFEMSSARRALVVDDQRSWRDVLSRLLESRGLQVDSASTLKEAAHLASTRQYDVALLDMRLADMDVQDSAGLNVAELVRDYNPEALTVLVSGYSSAENVRDAMRLGVDDYWDKGSFNYENLDRLLDKAALRRETERQSHRQSQLGRLMHETLAMMSHELRSPLLTIQRNVEALHTGALGSLTSQQAETVEVIRAAARREFVLISAHLDVTRIERGAERLDVQKRDLVKLVREEVEAHRADAQRRSVRLRTNLPRQEVAVEIDANRLRLALNPVMDNAIKFSPEGGQVRVRVSRKLRYVEVHVADQGPGMKPEELDHLLNWRFTETASFTQRMRTSGLGLNICKRMVELHEGRLWIESDGRSGTTVKFRLPIQD